MVDVKVLSLPPLPEGVDVHVVALTDRLLQQVQPLGWVLPGGTTITELSELLCMTEQAGVSTGSGRRDGRPEPCRPPGRR